jgi:hypothetical protein
MPAGESAGADLDERIDIAGEVPGNRVAISIRTPPAG